MTDDKPGEWVTVGARSAMKKGEVLGITAQGKEIAIYDLDGTLYATENTCTHAYAYLSDGWLDGDIIECPLHGGRFEIKTGKGLGPPIDCDLKTFPVRLQGEDIQVKLEG
jgi:nitrite reductase/ring-hydroxylating ferredoxin subunit